jgi:hypothetical protein
MVNRDSPLLYIESSLFLLLKSPRALIRLLGPPCPCPSPVKWRRLITAAWPYGSMQITDCVNYPGRL